MCDFTVHAFHENSFPYIRNGRHSGKEKLEMTPSDKITLISVELFLCSFENVRGPQNAISEQLRECQTTEGN